jgi:hypothetical protein
MGRSLPVDLVDQIGESRMCPMVSDPRICAAVASAVAGAEEAGQYLHGLGLASTRHQVARTLRYEQQSHEKEHVAGMICIQNIQRHAANPSHNTGQWTCRRFAPGNNWQETRR